MADSENTVQKSAFDAHGFEGTLEAIKREIQELYLSDRVPWVVGYSGGKDSTATLQLVWFALKDLDEAKLTKPVHVITTDTLVENPVVAAWVNRSLTYIQEAADQQGLPIYPHRLTPKTEDSFWVNLIGKGYPAPRNKFRWCTERLKIKPSNEFIRSVVKENGEAILVLGTRKAESAKRAHNMNERAKDAIRDRLTPNGNLPNSLVYTPIEDWSNDDIWVFLVNSTNPWGYDNDELLDLYRGATQDNECALVVDTSTPSCGNSRFGCWVCTLVDEDKSMGAMIHNDDEKQWMQPLLDLRNELDFRSDEKREKEKNRRDFRRLGGKLHYYEDSDGEGQLIRGPYTQEARAHWLRRVLEVQQYIRDNGPDHVGNIELITPEELDEIRRIWVVEKHEIEDRLPEIYQEVVGSPFDGKALDTNLVFDRETLNLLKEVADDQDPLQFEMVRNLLDIERRYRSMTKRVGLFSELEKAVDHCLYSGEEDYLETMSRWEKIFNPQEESDSGGTGTGSGNEEQLTLPTE